MRTLLRYPGGKSRAYHLISNKIPKLPYPNEIVSPFLGGGSMESRWAHEWQLPVYGFDLFEHLVNFWNVLLEDPNGLADKFEELGSSKEAHVENADKLLRSEMTQKLLVGFEDDYAKKLFPKDEWFKFSDLDMAAMYLQNMHFSYGPRFLGCWTELNAEPERLTKFVRRIRKYKNPNLKVGLSPFDEVIPNFPDSLIYLDPPYYLADDGGNKMSGGLYPSSEIRTHHDYFDHELMRDQLHNHRGPFILSYNDCPTIREYYKDFKQEFPVWHYSYSQGTGGKTESHEILILKDVEV